MSREANCKSQKLSLFDKIVKKYCAACIHLRNMKANFIETSDLEISNEFPYFCFHPNETWGDQVVRRCWVNFQCRDVLLIWIIVGQGPIALAIGAGGVCLDIFFSHLYHFSFLSPSLWETARYRLKYCLKGPLSPKQPTQRNSWTTHESNFNPIALRTAKTQWPF